MTERNLSTSDESHPIVIWLTETLRSFEGKKFKPSDHPIYRAVLDYGRPYIGIDRPKGYRQRKAKACFGNAALLALEERGAYVEGFAMSFDQPAFHHAWITLDAKHAIDTTLPNATERQYFGILFPKRIVFEQAQRRGGDAGKLLDPFEVCGVGPDGAAHRLAPN
jgi:hypothetical protein